MSELPGWLTPTQRDAIYDAQKRRYAFDFGEEPEACVLVDGARRGLVYRDQLKLTRNSGYPSWAARFAVADTARFPKVIREVNGSIEDVVRRVLTWDMEEGGNEPWLR